VKINKGKFWLLLVFSVFLSLGYVGCKLVLDSNLKPISPRTLKKNYLYYKVGYDSVVALSIKMYNNSGGTFKSFSNDEYKFDISGYKLNDTLARYVSSNEFIHDKSRLAYYLYKLSIVYDLVDSTTVILSENQILQTNFLARESQYEEYVFLRNGKDTLDHAVYLLPNLYYRHE
jgi:hypothetical protein